MPRTSPKPPDVSAELALRLTEALQRERIIPRFVDSYVVEHGRQALQAHASLYRDLLGLLQREALLTLCVRSLEIISREGPPLGKKSGPLLMRRNDVTVFRRKFLTALTRQQQWSAGDALDFQSDLHMYEDLLSRNMSPRRTRKPFEAANHPFVDRCAFLMDSSFLEKARLAASPVLTTLETLAAQVVASVFGQSPTRTSR